MKQKLIKIRQKNVKIILKKIIKTICESATLSEIARRNTETTKLKRKK